MDRIILIARIFFICIAIMLVAAAAYVLIHRDALNGANALTVLLSAGAAVGAISSWNPLKQK
jgi:NADH:ubiquinone oxidoreductase subunit 6 (subunit J)